MSLREEHSVDCNDLPGLRLASSLFGRRNSRTVTEHVFKEHNYMYPTFCEHCGDLLVGVIKQGVRCKRCEVDVHEKCQEDLQQPCIELIVGRHHFQLRSYHHLTYCDYCEELLVGVVHQGLQCSECTANVHERCQEQIEIDCGAVKARLTRKRLASQERKRHRSTSKEKRDPIETMPSHHDNESFEESSVFERMPAKNNDEAQTSAHTSIPIPQPPNKIEVLHQKQACCDSTAFVEIISSHRNRRLPLPYSGKAIYFVFLCLLLFRSFVYHILAWMRNTNFERKFLNMVEDAANVMKDNAFKIIDRQVNLSQLKKTSQEVSEKSKLFQKTTKSIETKYWWKNKKWAIILIVAVFLFITIIVIVVLLKNSL